jgi:hypothetical protein
MAFARRLAAALGALVVCTLAAAAPAAARTNHALIVAVTDYENFGKRLWLKGPNNDLVLAYHFLTGLGGAAAFRPENIRMLMTPHNDTQRAIAVDNTAVPTREAILEALADIAEQALEGDFVFLHLGGHGSQQLNVTDPNETDGKDEVFLPFDAGAPTPGADGVSHYPNAITDNDFAKAINAIRAKGADVWAIFDFCHSGSVTRGEEIDRRVDMVADFGVSPQEAPAPEEEASRALVAPLDLRELEAAPSASPGTGVPLAPGVSERGTLVAFFAAQNSEPTKEKPFLDEATQLALPYGIFSRALYGALATNRHPDMSYHRRVQSPDAVDRDGGGRPDHLARRAAARRERGRRAPRLARSGCRSGGRDRHLRSPKRRGAAKHARACSGGGPDSRSGRAPRRHLRPAAKRRLFLRAQRRPPRDDGHGRSRRSRACERRAR